MDYARSDDETERTEERERALPCECGCWSCSACDVGDPALEALRVLVRSVAGQRLRVQARAVLDHHAGRASDALEALGRIGAPAQLGRAVESEADWREQCADGGDA